MTPRFTLSMKITQLDLSDKKRVQDFLDLPLHIYKDIPQWVPPLRMDERIRLDPKRYPFYKHSQARFFLAYEGISCHWTHRRNRQSSLQQAQ